MFRTCMSDQRSEQSDGVGPVAILAIPALKEG